MIELLATLCFGAGQSGTTCLREGWSAPEEDFVWSVGPESRIVVDLPRPRDLLALDITLTPFVHDPAVPTQGVEILVGGAVVERRVLARMHRFRLDLPPGTGQNGTGLEIVLRHPGATSPAALGLGTDGRALGMRLSALTLLGMDGRDALPPRSGPGRMVEHRFGLNDPPTGVLLEGWAAPEADHVWATGSRSLLEIPMGLAEGETRLVLDLLPALRPPALTRQRIAIGANGHLLGFFALPQRTCLGFVLPATVAAAPRLTLSFDNLDAAGDAPLVFMLCGVRVFSSPALPGTAPATRAAIGGALEDGSLQNAVREITGRGAEDVASVFLSLGTACEMGLLQRRLGREPNGLLRFATSWTPCLIENLLNGFWGLGREDMLKLNVRADPGRSFWIEDSGCMLLVQTAVSSVEAAPDRMRRQLSRSLPFLKRKFFEDLAGGERICVFQRRDATVRAEAEAVLAALSLWADVTLLWVEPDDARAGEAERLGPRLLHGYVDTRTRAGHGSDESWLSMLANAWMLHGAP